MSQNTNPAELLELRKKIDELDKELISLMARRFEVTRQVGLLKAEHNLPKADPEREEKQIERLKKLAEEADLNPAFSERLLRLIIEEVIRDYARN